MHWANATRSLLYDSARCSHTVTMLFDAHSVPDVLFATEQGCCCHIVYAWRSCIHAMCLLVGGVADPAMISHCHFGCVALLCI